jgi:cytochrome P450
MHYQWMKQYGHIVRLYDLFAGPRLFISDPELIKHVTGKAVYNYIKPPLTRGIFESVTGHGLLVAEGAEHKQQRKMLQTVFSHKYIQHMAPEMHAKSMELVTKWRHDVVKCSELIIDTDVSRVALNIIGATGFGFEFDALLSDGNNALCKAYETLSDFPMDVSFVLGFTFPWTKPFIPYFRRAAKAEVVVDTTLRRLIRDRQEAIMNGNVDGTDLLTVLLMESMSEGTTLSETELLSQIMTVAIAGHETTSTSLSWALYMLAEHPDVQDKLRTEIQHAIPNLDQAPTANQLDKLQYLDHVIKETLRYCSPVAGIMRQAQEQDMLPNGVIVPQGTLVEMFMNVNHMMEETWGKDVDTFNPERWAHISNQPNFQFAYFPFSCGPRICIGMKLAMLELKMLLVCLLFTFEFNLADERVTRTKMGLSRRADPYMKLALKPLYL